MPKMKQNKVVTSVCYPHLRNNSWNGNNQKSNLPTFVPIILSLESFKN